MPRKQLPSGSPNDAPTCRWLLPFAREWHATRTLGEKIMHSNLNSKHTGGDAFACFATTRILFQDPRAAATDEPRVFTLIRVYRSGGDLSGDGALKTAIKFDSLILASSASKWQLSIHSPVLSPLGFLFFMLQLLMRRSADAVKKATSLVAAAPAHLLPMADPSMPPLPAAFLRFLEQNQIDAAVYSAAHALPRYVRLKEQAVLELVEIEEELGVKLTRVAWLPGFFSLPPDAQIAGSCAYQQGKLYGIDAASGAAVTALEVSHCDHVLDLCAAPGAKLCMVAELLGASGSLTAVDIAQPRLAACRTMLQKYGLGSQIRLYLGDGTTFSLLPLKEITKLPDFHLGAEGEISTDSRLEVLKYYGEWRPGKSRKQKRATKLAKHLGIPVQRGDGPELFFYGKESGVVGMKVGDLPQSKCMHSEATLQDGYDKVLVDAECTHDGSLKHIIKYEQWGWDTFERRFLDADRVASITLLQLQLLTNGFRLLKPGGTLVYSTCSFTKTQNEGVVERFLTNEANAELKEVDPAKHWPCRPGDLPHTLRFDPVTSNTSGLFIAKIVKRVT